jgi:hypothetical protein
MVGRPGKYQPRFTSGEVDPLLLGNTDEGAYLKAAQLMQNVHVLPQGGFTLMDGTYSLGAVPNAASGASLPNVAPGALSNVKMKPFTHARGTAFDIVFYDEGFDVYSQSGYLASGVVALSTSQIPTMDFVQQLDTMLLFHQAVAPIRVTYNGGASWAVDAPPWQNIPNYMFPGATYTNGTAAVWLIEFFNATAGNVYQMSVNGVIGTSQTYSGTPATDAARVLASINSVPEVGSGLTVTIGGSTTPGGYPVPSGFLGIEFTGANNVGDGWAVAGSVLNNASAAIPAAHAVQGILPGEAIMSFSRGWPSCGAFYSGRLVLGGFAQVPNALLASEGSNYWQLDTQIVGANAPMLLPLDVEGAAQVLRLMKGNTLLIFTNDGEYWLNASVLDATSTPGLIKASSNGVAPGCKPVFNEGKAIYTDAFQGAAWEFVYNLSVQNYESQPLSVRCSSLVSGLADQALRRLNGATQCNQIWYARGDGLGICEHVLRAEDINAYTRRVTDGEHRAVCVNDRREVSFVVQRTVGNGQQLFAERTSSNYLVDGAIAFSFGSPQTTITGLSAHEGRSVWVIGDGNPQGPYTVSGGAITLGFAAQQGYVGRWTPPVVTTMPQPRDIAPRTVMRRPCRVHTVRVLVENTTSLAIAANGQGPFDVPVVGLGGAPTDIPALSAPFTGWLAIEGLQGFSDDGTVTITQLRPGLLTVNALDVEVDL